MPMTSVRAAQTWISRPPCLMAGSHDGHCTLTKNQLIYVEEETQPLKPIHSTRTFLLPSDKQRLHTGVICLGCCTLQVSSLRISAAPQPQINLCFQILLLQILFEGAITKVFLVSTKVKEIGPKYKNPGLVNHLLPTSNSLSFPGQIHDGVNLGSILTILIHTLLISRIQYFGERKTEFTSEVLPKF